MNDVGKENRR